MKCFTNQTSLMSYLTKFWSICGLALCVLALHFILSVIVLTQRTYGNELDKQSFRPSCPLGRSRINYYVNDISCEMSSETPMTSLEPDATYASDAPSGKLLISSVRESFLLAVKGKTPMVILHAGTTPELIEPPGIAHSSAAFEAAILVMLAFQLWSNKVHMADQPFAMDSSFAVLRYMLTVASIKVLQAFGASLCFDVSDDMHETIPIAWVTKTIIIALSGYEKRIWLFQCSGIRMLPFVSLLQRLHQRSAISGSEMQIAQYALYASAIAETILIAHVKWLQPLCLCIVCGAFLVFFYIGVRGVTKFVEHLSDAFVRKIAAVHVHIARVSCILACITAPLSIYCNWEINPFALAFHIACSVLLPMLLCWAEFSVTHTPSARKRVIEKERIQRKFFRWVFHELRSPANDVALAISLCKNNISDAHTHLSTIKHGMADLLYLQNYRNSCYIHRNSNVLNYTDQNNLIGLTDTSGVSSMPTMRRESFPIRTPSNTWKEYVNYTRSSDVTYRQNDMHADATSNVGAPVDTGPTKEGSKYRPRQNLQEKLVRQESGRCCVPAVMKPQPARLSSVPLSIESPAYSNGQSCKAIRPTKFKPIELTTGRSTEDSHVRLSECSSNPSIPPNAAMMITSTEYSPNQSDSPAASALHRAADSESASHSPDACEDSPPGPLRFNMRNYSHATCSYPYTMPGLQPPSPSKNHLNRLDSVSQTIRLTSQKRVNETISTLRGAWRGLRDAQESLALMTRVMDRARDFAVVASTNFEPKKKQFSFSSILLQEIFRAHYIAVHKGVILHSIPMRIVGAAASAFKAGDVVIGSVCGIGDKDRIAAAMRIILENGVRFTRPGGSVKVECEIECSVVDQMMPGDLFRSQQYANDKPLPEDTNEVSERISDSSPNLLEKTNQKSSNHAANRGKRLPSLTLQSCADEVRTDISTLGSSLAVQQYNIPTYGENLSPAAFASTPYVDSVADKLPASCPSNAKLAPSWRAKLEGLPSLPQYKTDDHFSMHRFIQSNAVSGSKSKSRPDDVRRSGSLGHHPDITQVPGLRDFIGPKSKRHRRRSSFGSDSKASSVEKRDDVLSRLIDQWRNGAMQGKHSGSSRSEEIGNFKTMLPHLACETDLTQVAQNHTLRDLFVVFRVSDTGIGMTTEQIAKLFGDPFECLKPHGATKNVGGDSGESSEGASGSGEPRNHNPPCSQSKIHTGCEQTEQTGNVTDEHSSSSESDMLSMRGRSSGRLSIHIARASIEKHGGKLSIKSGGRNAGTCVEIRIPLKGIILQHSIDNAAPCSWPASPSCNKNSAFPPTYTSAACGEISNHNSSTTCSSNASHQRNTQTTAKDTRPSRSEIGHYIPTSMEEIQSECTASSGAQVTPSTGTFEQTSTDNISDINDTDLRIDVSKHADSGDTCENPRKSPYTGKQSRIESTNSSDETNATYYRNPPRSNRFSSFGWRTPCSPYPETPMDMVGSTEILERILQRWCTNDKQQLSNFDFITDSYSLNDYWCRNMPTISTKFQQERIRDRINYRLRHHYITEPHIQNKLMTRQDSARNTNDTSKTTEPSQIRFLVVDDVATTRRLLQRVIHRHYPAAVVDVAADGKTATSSVSRNGSEYYAAITMDKEMPVLDGYKATRILREKMGFRNRIIGLTGNAMQEDISAFKDAGADVVLTKPIDAAQILRELKKVT